MRILVVENHAALANEIVRKIERAGFEVDLVETIQHARTTIDDCVYSLALLDRRLPDGDGVSLIPFIRTKQPVTRIFLLTALDAVDDRIEGLEAGADDYLTKPFNLDELVARIRAHLRRSGGEPTPPIRLGEMTFDFEQRTASVRGRPIQFSRRELILLEALLRRANRVVSRSSLTSLLYGRGLEVQEHALTSLASRLRVRLAELDAGVEIRSARALGYIICEVVADEA
jgi:two-component system OmpR family response regulator